MSVAWQLVFALLVVCVVIEGIAILALARAIGLLQVRLGPAPAALQTADGLPLYADAPMVSGFDLRLQRPIVLNTTRDRWGVVFVGPTCGDCRRLIREAGRVDRAPAWGARVVVVSQGTHDQNAVLAELAPELMFISDPNGDVFKAFEVESTPYAFLIEGGRIQAKGIVNHRDHLEALLEGRTTSRGDVLWTQADSDAAIRLESVESADSQARQEVTQHGN